MTERDREIDVSTGRPRAKTDAEAYDEIRTQHADSWRDRDGEGVRVFILRDGFTFAAQVWDRGQVIECKVGDDRWIQSLDPATGKSMLELDPVEQQARWGRRFYVPIDGEIAGAPDNADEEFTPTADDRVAFGRSRFDARATLPKGEQQMYANLEAIWAEDEERRNQPLEQFTAQRWISKPEGGEF